MSTSNLGLNSVHGFLILVTWISQILVSSQLFTTLQLSQVDLKWSCRLIDNLMGCIFEPAPYSHGEFVMYMPKIDFWLIFFPAEVKISSRSLLKTLSHTRSVLPELCSPNVRPQIVFKVYFSHRHFRICFK